MENKVSKKEGVKAIFKSSFKKKKLFHIRIQSVKTSAFYADQISASNYSE